MLRLSSCFKAVASVEEWKAFQSLNVNVTHLLEGITALIENDMYEYHVP